MNAQLDTPATTETSAPALPGHLKRIVLTGFMGAGKSTIGRLLAECLGWSFLDLDAHLEARAGATIPELFTTKGEEHFRKLESLALVSALGKSSTVLALGGGTPELLTNRLLLEQTPGTAVVFLDAPFETLFDRCVLQNADRPVLANPEAARVRFATRQPIYRRLARVTLPTESLTPEQSVASLVTLLEKITPGRY
ncbi:MAG TPA: shikimate kinase [Granulicella sp.]